MANSGNIVKAKCDKPFTWVFNDVIRDERISLRARGLLIYILSLPDDWVLHKTTLDKIIFKDVERTDEKGKRLSGEKREGRDAVFSAFDELIENNYISSEMKVNPENGRIDGYDYIVYNRFFLESPVTDLPITDNPISDNPQLTKEIDLQNKDTTKKNIIKDLEPPADSARKEKINAAAEADFDWFWKKYPIKLNKQHAKFLFLKLKISDRLELKENLDAWLGYKPFDKYNYPHPTTFINKKRWLDEIPNAKKIEQKEIIQRHFMGYSEYLEACEKAGIAPKQDDGLYNKF